jgi:hypothetical protein
MNDFNIVNQGWQCPCCNRVYSPSTVMCYYCGNYELVTTDSITLGDTDKIRREEGAD